MKMQDTRGPVSSKKQRQVDHMVNRFLAYKFPADMHPDGGLSFKPTFNEHMAFPMRYEPTGTNLLSAEQAKAMILHLLDGLPE
jgi:hypothetical protein